VFAFEADAQQPQLWMRMKSPTTDAGMFEPNVLAMVL
jgi:hypothetical protein